MLPSELPDLPPETVVALDTETSGLHPDDVPAARVSTVSLAWRTPEIDGGRLVSVAWPFHQGKQGKPEDDGQDELAIFGNATDNLPWEQWHELLMWLEDRERLVMHNAKFDVAMMRAGVGRTDGTAWGGVDLLEQVWWDTSLVANYLWPKESAGLKPTAARLWGEDEKGEQEIVKKYLLKHKLPSGRWDLMPWDTIGKYAAKDAELTLRLYEHQYRGVVEGREAEWTGSLQDGGMRALAEIGTRHDIMRMLGRLERRGMPYDPVVSRKAARKARERGKEYAARLPFNKGGVTGAKASAYWFGSKEDGGLGLRPYAFTPGGKPQLTAEIVDRMVEDEVEHAKVYREYTKIESAASMWYEGYADKTGLDGRLRTSFRQTGTRSSRFSVGRVNLQAIPQDYRLGGYESLEGLPTPRTIIAGCVPDGWDLYELDLAQAELRVAAMMAKCETMLSAIREGRDLHGETATALFDVTPKSESWKEMRQLGKRANFTLQFGAGGQTFSRMCKKELGGKWHGLPDSWYKRVVDDWRALYPEFGKAIEHTQSVVERRIKAKGIGWIDLWTGERRWVMRDEDTHKAFNQRVQANLAQYAARWWLAVEDYCNGTLGLEQRGMEAGIGGAGAIMTIHDSVWLLVPQGEEGAKIVEHCCDLGVNLWDQVFPGVPGGVDAQLKSSH